MLKLDKEFYFFQGKQFYFNERQKLLFKVLTFIYVYAVKNRKVGNFPKTQKPYETPKPSTTTKNSKPSTSSGKFLLTYKVC